MEINDKDFTTELCSCRPAVVVCIRDYFVHTAPFVHTDTKYSMNVLNEQLCITAGVWLWSHGGVYIYALHTIPVSLMCRL